MGVVNTRYFNLQQIALDHRVEEREINNTLHDDDGRLKEDRRDLALHDLQ